MPLGHIPNTTTSAALPVKTLNLSSSTQPIPPLTDALDLHSLAVSLPLVNASSTSSPFMFPQPIAPSPSSHPILRVHITNNVKFQGTAAGENFFKWRQIVTFLLTMYKALDHIAEGAAPAVPDDLWMVVDIHISLWFMGTLSDDLYRLVSSSDCPEVYWGNLHCVGVIL